ncbi:hypothetical protein AVEN_173597-1 [Araneus ventricosus]|uniref:Uncharacterized protein n=1 Tax=Araneus ventricosus TaxID=182803 RepID=A0A4Y2CQV0_ARAVE|nr:hypothetical protein AVEN_173597-1 [Araneus ventricosus]
MVLCLRPFVKFALKSDIKRTSALSSWRHQDWPLPISLRKWVWCVLPPLHVWTISFESPCILTAHPKLNPLIEMFNPRNRGIRTSFIKEKLSRRRLLTEEIIPILYS